MKRGLLFLFFCLAVSGARAQRAVSGVVLDGSTVTLLPGVKISTASDTATITTDAEGRFEVSVPAAGTLLRFRLPGYEAVQQVMPAGRHFTTVFLYPAYPRAGKEETVQGVNITAEGSPVKHFGMPVAIKAHQDETYEQVAENPFQQAAVMPFSSFMLNADDASFCNVRRFITNKELPPKEAVRIEEMVNYLPCYHDLDPTSRRPMSFQAEVTTCPWKAGHWLLRIAAETAGLPADTLLPNNLVLLIDVSGSMEPADKLPLLKKAFRALVNQLDSLDKIAIVVYAGNVSLALPSTPGNQKHKILDVINNLSAGGSTAGKAGIEMAFKLAKENFITHGNNRVIMATDGDFNVGESSDADMRKLITRYHNWKVYLTCIGVGKGNYKDSKLETLAQWGLGNFIYLDNAVEAERVFGPDDYRKILVTAVRNACIKTIFNPEIVKAYRLIGYESKAYGTEKDSLITSLPGGEIGAGQRITAFYELTPVQASAALSGRNKHRTWPKDPPEGLATMALQYQTVADSSDHLEMKQVPLKLTAFERSDQRLQFAAAVTLFGMLLRHSDYTGSGTYDKVTGLVRHIKDKSYKEQRKAFLKLVQKAAQLEQE